MERERADHERQCSAHLAQDRRIVGNLRSKDSQHRRRNDNNRRRDAERTLEQTHYGGLCSCYIEGYGHSPFARVAAWIFWIDLTIVRCKCRQKRLRETAAGVPEGEAEHPHRKQGSMGGRGSPTKRRCRRRCRVMHTDFDCHHKEEGDKGQDARDGLPCAAFAVHHRFAVFGCSSDVALNRSVCFLTITSSAQQSPLRKDSEQQTSCTYLRK
mmetsp:Transcript_3585/g.10189  ORF Transcript_3585/g.10189 Transcript_3585/m.10189 type:complete len:212 (-) Transcript_3585:1130-1765(-)